MESIFYNWRYLKTMKNKVFRLTLTMGFVLTVGFGCVVSVMSGNALADQKGDFVPALNRNISEADVLTAQKAWGEALVKISKDYERGGFKKAKATAEATLDSAYGYKFGPVLFKPTLTTSPQTFRTTREGALAYFVGGDSEYPNDTGFALKGWRSVEVKNVALYLNGSTAMSMGNVTLINKDGASTTVDKTWGYVRDDQGALRIVLHHSSLPHVE